MQSLSERLQEVRGRIAEAADAVGRDPLDIQLVAVSKTYPPENVREAIDAGLDTFGESRVQEALAKIPELPGHLHWHFIGHLQKNKIRKALPHFELFHGVDGFETARQMDRIAGEEGCRPRVLLEVNLAGEGSKFGFKAEELESGIEELLELPRLEVEGLMGMAPIVKEPTEARPWFAGLRELRDRLALTSGVPLTTLSMGMTGDFEAAIAEGATIVRIGSAIFGPRP